MSGRPVGCVRRHADPEPSGRSSSLLLTLLSLFMSGPPFAESSPGEVKEPEVASSIRLIGSQEIQAPSWTNRPPDSINKNDPFPGSVYIDELLPLKVQGWFL